MSTVLSNSTKHVPILQLYDIGSPGSSTRIPLADFQALIAWILERGYHPISLSDYAAWMAGSRDLPARQCIVLTLWGGFTAQYTLAYPFLRAQNVKFNFVLPCSFIENEESLHTGIYFGVSALQEMLGTGLAEAHSEGYHLKWLFRGNPAATARVFTANGQNLNWGGTEEFVEDAYSIAPLIGTNISGAAITTTRTFKCAPRAYLDTQPGPSQIVVTAIALDHLAVLGTAYPTTSTLKAKRHADTSWTTIRNSWQPDWSNVFSEIALDAPFTFQAGVQYDLQFMTNSAGPGHGELVILGSRTAGNPKLPGALWRANTFVPSGTQILDFQGDIEQVQTAGTTGSFAPSWSMLLNGLTNDRTVVWKNLGTPSTAGVATTCASNSSVPGFVMGEQIGGDIHLLESLGQESDSDVSGRVYEDALHALALLADWTGSRQEGFAFGYPFNTYRDAGIFLPAALSSLHGVQLFASDLLNDRWSLLDSRVYFGPSATGLPKGATTPVLTIDGTRGLANLENQIDAHSGLHWDVAPNWNGWQSFGWVNEFAADYATELEKYAATWSYITSPRLRFNSDGLTLNAEDLDTLEVFLALPEILGRKVLCRVTNEADSGIAHNIFANAGASIARLQTILQGTFPDLAGLALDIEGTASSDRSIASSWITALRSARDSGFPGKLLVAAVPAKASDSPTDPWSGWCDYTAWLTQVDYAAPLTYGYSDGSAPAAPGPSSPIPWMQSAFDYASGLAPKSKLVIMLCFYGTWRAGGPNWSASNLCLYYDSLQQARAANATWTWDAANSEWFWSDGAGTNKGYQPTPESMKVRLDAFGAQGYSNFGVWAIGQGDSLFYQYAEGSTPTAAPFLKVPQGVEQSITQLEGQSSLGALDLEVVDCGGAMTALVSAGKLEGKKATLRVGYPGMALSEFVTVATQQIDTVNILDDYTGYRINCRDLKRSAKQKVFLCGDDGRPLGKDHPRRLLANPMDAALLVLQNELGIGQTTPLEAAWRLYDPSQWNGASNPTLINPNPFVDVNSFLNYRNGCFAGYLLEFNFTEAVEAKQFLEYEICKALGGWLQTNAQGQIVAMFFSPQAMPTGLFVFDETNCLALPSMERFPITNQVTYRMDYDGSDFQCEMNFVDAASVQQFNLQGQQVIESKGLRRAHGGSSLAALTAWRIFQRFGGVDPAGGIVRAGALVYTVKSFFMTLGVETGDFVYLTHPLMPNLLTGTRGVVRRLCQVTDRQPNYADGNMTFKLLDVGWQPARTLSKIAAVDTPAWTSASPQQRAAYAFLAAGSTNAFSDGSAAKNIW
ncbi:MAG TPA: glycosyl hydrolase family 18 protein [Terriglobia bacterium]|nr:glycosyl hydrolase family 18 protein [Terriglobia bacterium]